MAVEVFDLEMFRLGADHAPPSQPVRVAQPAPLPQKAIEGEFLAAIPWAWVGHAMRLPGSALTVALLIRHLHKMRGPSPVALSNVQAEKYGVSASAKRRALVELEKAGLITVERKAGCAPRVAPIEP